MTTAELSISRRDFLLPFAKKARIHPAQKIVRRPETNPPQPPSSNRNDHRRITRGTFVKGGIAAALGFTAVGAILRPWEQLSSGDEFVTPEIARLGYELQDWKLQDGRKMADLFPEVKLTAKLLQGQLDPKTLLPQFKAPINLHASTKDGNIGMLTIKPNFDHNDPRKIEIHTAKDSYSGNWLTGCTVQLQLAPNILASEERLYVAVKEISQLLYLSTYMGLYIDLLRKGGTTQLEIKNPTNIPTTSLEEIINFGDALTRFEIQKFGYSSLSDFIDVGSRLQTIPIGTTQKFDLQRRGRFASNLDWPLLEQTDADFLRSKGLLKETGNITTWVKPFAIDEEFFKLFVDYTRPIRPALIRPMPATR